MGRILDFGIQKDAKFENPVIEKLIDELFKNLRIMLTNERSGEVLREGFTNIRIILTSENGREYILTLARFVSFILRNENGAEILRIVCGEIIVIARDEVSGSRLMESILNFVKRVSAQPELVPAAEGFVAGLHAFLKDVTPQQMETGVGRITKMLSLYNTFIPKKSDNSYLVIKRDITVTDPFDRPFTSHLSSRSISHENKFSSKVAGY